MDEVIRYYEAMFLVDPLKAASNYDEVKNEIEKILKKHVDEIIEIRKYGERRLAYVLKKNLQKHERGCYILSYFSMNTQKMPNLKRDCSLSDNILRVMILKLDDKPELDKIPAIFEITAPINT